MTPLLTVLMPLKYYKLDFLMQAVGSLLEQTDPNWSLLIAVDENEHRHFSALLKDALADPRVRLTRGGGYAGKINVGMREARTEFASLLFADDRWSHEAVAVLNRRISGHPDVDFFHSSRIFMDESGRPISRVFLSREQVRLGDFKWGSPVKHLLCWRREKGLAVGGMDESLGAAGPDDYDFPWTMAENGARFMAIRECLYWARDHCAYNRMTTHTTLSEIGRQSRRILKKHGVGVFQRWKIVKRKIRRGNIGNQAVYRNALDRWLKQRMGRDPRRDWKQPRYLS